MYAGQPGPPGATRGMLAALAMYPTCFDLAARGHPGHQGQPVQGTRKPPAPRQRVGVRVGAAWAVMYFKMPMTLRMNSTPAGQGLRGLVKLLDVWPGARGQTAVGVHQELSGRSVVVQARATTGKKKTPKP